MACHIKLNYEPCISSSVVPPDSFSTTCYTQSAPLSWEFQGNCYSDYVIGKLWNDTGIFWRGHCMLLQFIVDQPGGDRLVTVFAEVTNSIWATEFCWDRNRNWTLDGKSLLPSITWNSTFPYAAMSVVNIVHQCAQKVRDQTMEPLEDERWMDWMRAARVFSRSRWMSQPGLSGGVSYNSCLNGSSSIRITMFFRK